MSVGLYSGVSGLALGAGLYKDASGLWGGASGLIDGFGGSNPYSGASLYLDFLSGSLDSRITFSRGTTGTFVGSNGLIQTAAINAPRFDYDPVTLAPRGLLIEEQRTNLLTGSADFTATYWPTATEITVTADNAVSPDGGTNADRLTDTTTADGQHRLFRSYTFTAAAHTLTVFAKRNDHRWFRLFMFDGTTSFYANFDLLNGVVGNKQASATSAITAMGNGWYRCALTATTVAALGNVQMVMLASDDTGFPSLYTGTGTSLWLYGAQLEAGAFATSYIPTVASTVTRSADQATMTGTNFSSWYNQSAGTFVADASVYSSGLSGNRKTLIAATEGNFNNLARAAVEGAASGGGAVAVGGVSQASFSAPGISASTPFKLALAMQADDFAFSLNGTSALTDNSGTVVAAPVFLDIGYGPQNSSGSANTAGDFLNGHIRRIAYYNTRLSNAQLQALTS